MNKLPSDFFVNRKWKLLPNCLETKIGTDAQSNGRDVRMSEVSKPFDQIQPNEGKYIVDPYPGLQVRLSV